MKKVLFTTFLSLLMGVAVFAQSTVKVTFKVNMGVAAYNGIFKVGTDSVTVRGDFQADAGDPGGNWQGYYFKMTKDAADTVYSVTVTFADSSVGKNFQFKFVMSNDSYESSPNRTFTLPAADTTLGTYYFNNDTVYKAPVATQSYTVTFIADLSSYIGTAPGKFDPSKDSIQIMGLNNWGGYTVTDLSGNRVLTPDPFQVGIYSTVLTFSGPVGDSVAWKFKAFPDSLFGNGGGYETGDNRWFYFTNKTVDTVGPTIPQIVILQPGLSNAVSVTFMVDMRKAKDAHTGLAIDPSKINFVGLKGGLPIIGNWGGNWTVADTADSTVTNPKTMWVLHDDGLNGDTKAGDNIWSIVINFPAGTPSGLVEYKYGCDYPGVDTVNGGSSYLDNEMGFGVNHQIVLQSSQTTMVIKNEFGTKDSVSEFTSVQKENNLMPNAYKLSQNYPNPFNPSTVINYSIPKSQLVTLKVYNILGQEVATLVNNVQSAGNYKVTFDASRLSSGIYFYSLTTGNFTASKKMILMK